MPNNSERITRQDSAFIRYNNSAELKEAAKFITNFSGNSANNDVLLIKNYVMNNNADIMKYAADSDEFFSNLKLQSSISSYLYKVGKNTSNAVVDREQTTANDFQNYITDKLYVLTDQDDNGNSLLHLAVHYNHLSIVKIIFNLSYKQPELLTMLNKAGKTPLQLAREYASNTNEPISVISKQIFNLLAQPEVPNITKAVTEQLSQLVFEKLYATRDNEYKKTVTDYIVKAINDVYKFFQLKCTHENGLFLTFLEKINLDFMIASTNKPDYLDKIIQIFKDYSTVKTANLFKLNNVYSLGKDLPKLANELSKYFTESITQYRHELIIQEYNNKLYGSVFSYQPQTDNDLDMSMLIENLDLNSHHHNLVGTTANED